MSAAENWRVLVALGLIGCVAAVAQARQVTVKLKNGQEFSGELIDQTSQSITIRVEGGATRRLPLDQLAGPIRERASLAETYRQKRSKVGEGDVAGRLEIARWLFDIADPAQQREAYTLALSELETILKIKPDSQEAKLMRDATTERLAKLGQGKPGADKARGSGAAEEGRPKLLTAAQINRMKAFEVDLSTRPPVLITDKVINEFLEKYTHDPVDPVMEPYRGREGAAAFKRLEGYEQLQIMFDLKAQEFYEKVVIRVEPKSLQTWRTIFHTQYVMRYCGRCHAEGKAPGLNLVRGVPGHEATAYTNLVLLARKEINGLPMISRDAPERSPLLQYGMSRTDAAMPHKEVPGLTPYFMRGPNDPKFLAMVEWIRSLYTDPSRMAEEPGETGAEPPAPAAGGGAEAPKARK